MNPVSIPVPDFLQNGVLSDGMEKPILEKWFPIALMILKSLSGTIT